MSDGAPGVYGPEGGLTGGFPIYAAAEGATDRRRKKMQSRRDILSVVGALGALAVSPNLPANAEIPRLTLAIGDSNCAQLLHFNLAWYGVQILPMQQIEDGGRIGALCRNGMKFTQRHIDTRADSFDKWVLMKALAEHISSLSKRIIMAPLLMPQTVEGEVLASGDVLARVLDTPTRPMFGEMGESLRRVDVLFACDDVRWVGNYIPEYDAFDVWRPDFNEEVIWRTGLAKLPSSLDYSMEFTLHEQNLIDRAADGKQNIFWHPNHADLTLNSRAFWAMY